MDFVKLPDEVESRKYIYRKVKRVGNVAMYSVNVWEGDERKVESKELKLHGYEVFIVKVQQEAEIYGRKYEAHEAYPSNEMFGKSAWAFKKLNFAEEKFNELVNIKENEVVSTEKRGRGRKASTNCKVISFKNHTFKKYENGVMSVCLNGKPVGGKYLLVEYMIDVLKMPKEKAESMKCHEIKDIIFS